MEVRNDAVRQRKDGGIAGPNQLYATTEHSAQSFDGVLDENSSLASPRRAEFVPAETSAPASDEDNRLDARKEIGRDDRRVRCHGG